MTKIVTRIDCVHPEEKDGEVEMMLVEDDMAYVFECPKCQRQVVLYPFEYYVDSKTNNNNLEPEGH